MNHNLQGQKIQKQLENASRLGSKFAIFMDAEASVNGNVEVKDLKTGEQKVISLSEITNN